MAVRAETMPVINRNVCALDPFLGCLGKKPMSKSFWHSVQTKRNSLANFFIMMLHIPWTLFTYSFGFISFCSTLPLWLFCFFFWKEASHFSPQNDQGYFRCSVRSHSILLKLEMCNINKPFALAFSQLLERTQPNGVRHTLLWKHALIQVNNISASLCLLVILLFHFSRIFKSMKLEPGLQLAFSFPWQFE